jgi:hypothetical protein
MGNMDLGGGNLRRANVTTTSPVFMATETITTDATLDETNGLVLVDASGGDVVVTLPTAVGITGRSYEIKKTDTSVNTVTVDGDGTETIDGELTQDVPYLATIVVRSDGSNWFIV